MAFLALTNNSAQSQICPPGYQLIDFKQAYNMDCHYRISFCYKCDPFGTNGSVGDITNIYYEPVYPYDNCDGINQDSLDAWIRDQVITKLTTLCSVPSCNNGYSVWTIEMPLCKKYRNIVYKKEDGTTGNYIFKENCPDQLVCIEEYEVCYNQSTGQYETNLIDSEVDGSYCNLLEPDISGMNNKEPWVSECWQYYNCPLPF